MIQEATIGIPASKEARAFCNQPNLEIKDDPDLKIPFKKGIISYAGNGDDSRGCQLFITLKDSRHLGKAQWERALGFVLPESFPVIDKIFTEYDDKPDQGKIQSHGNQYLQENFPKLDKFLHCKQVKTPKTYIEMILGGANDIDGKKVKIEVNRSLAPLGADRFLELVQNKFYDDARFFRVIQNFVAQFGINGDPATNNKWSHNAIDDDPVLGTNVAKTISFATSGPNTRSTQLFINYNDDNKRLDGMGFSPFAEVVDGWEYVLKINSEYGEQPDQGKISQHGNDYLQKHFPRLSYIKSMRVIDISLLLSSNSNVLEQYLQQPEATQIKSSLSEGDTTVSPFAYYILFIAPFIPLIAVFIIYLRHRHSRKSTKSLWSADKQV